MNWIGLGKIVLRIAGTAVGITEMTSSDGPIKGLAKLTRAVGIAKQLAGSCQELSPQELQVMETPEVKSALEVYMTAQVKLENAIATAHAALLKK